LLTRRLAGSVSPLITLMFTGTVGAVLAARYDMVHVSSGDLLRLAVEAGGEMGEEVQEYMQGGELVPDELVTYRSGRHTRETSAGGVLSFFVDDWRFEAAWNYPNRFVTGLLSSGWAAVCEPDFSVWSDVPPAEQIWAVYRARWCARFWQERGLSVIPCLNWSNRSSYRWAWDGIPVGVPVVAIECQTHGGNLEAFNEGLAAACERVQPKHLLIYGKASRQKATRADGLGAIGRLVLTKG
jgi:hypothetical protein